MKGPCLDIHGFPRVLRDGEGARVRVIKVRPRLARPSNSWALSRDTVGALNIGLRALAPGGRGLASPSTEPPCGVGEAGDPMLRVTPGLGLRLRVLRSTVLWEALGYCSSRRLWLGFKLFTLKGFLIW